MRAFLPILFLLALVAGGPAQVFAQPRLLTGQVTDQADGIPLPGVNIQVKDTSIGTITGLDGNYEVQVPGASAILVFSFVGYTPQEITVGEQTVINVALSQEAEVLDDVVVIAYGQVRKSDLTGSVSSISGEDLLRTSPTSLDQALQGRAAGVQVTQVSGRPGGETSIRIRGSSSINAGNEPLYVVDGMLITSDNGQMNAGGVAGSNLNGLSAINPSDIESIEILKDASATAMYGSRGANGVVLITTKRGKEGKSSITLDAYYGLQEVQKQLNMLDGEAFANYINAFNKDAGFPVDPRYLIPDKIGAGTDWQEAIFQRAPMQSYQLSFLGGNSSTQYSVSGGYYLQEGILLNSDFERYNLRTNLDQNVNDRVKVGASISLSHINSRGVLTGAQSPGTGVLLPGASASALLFPPTLPVLDERVPGGYTYEDDRGRNIANPVADAAETENISKNSRVIGSVYGTLRLAEGLSLKGSIGIDGFSVQENRFVPNFLKRTEANNGEAVVATVDGFTWLTEFTLNYKRTFKDKHAIDALAGTTFQGFQSERLFTFALDFPDNRTGYHNLGSALNPQPPANGESSWGIISYLGRVNYTLSNKYLFTLTGRLDGASKFGEDNKYGFFPSGSVAWKLHQEPFIEQLGLFTSLKARLSYGIIGNQEIGPFGSLATVGPVGQGVFNNNEPYIGQEPLRYPNPGLKWERTNQADFGVDAEFLDGRISFTADYYLKNTTDLLLFAPLPTTTGFSSYLANIGELKNQGFEAAINSRNTTGALLWQTSLNFSTNRNEITELASDSDIPVPGVLQVPAGWSILRAGQPLGTFFGLRSAGIFQSDAEAQSAPSLRGQNAEAGDRRYVDLNGRDDEGNLTGQPDGVIDEADRTIIGDANPNFIWGLTNTFSFKGIDLSIFIQGVQGSEIVNAYLFEIGTMTGEVNVLAEYWENRWTENNPSNKYPKVNPNERNIFSDAQVEDGSFIRIKNITLGYTFPAQWLSKIRMSSARFYLSINNLYTLSDYRGYDPEINAFGQNNLLQGIDYGGYPLARTAIVGLQLGF